MALSRKTTDHEEIQKWAEARGAKPAEVASTHQGNNPGILRFEFPHAPHHNDSALQEISWDDFFKKFDESDLELLYQDVTVEGAQSNFNKLIHPTDDDHSSRATPAKKSAKIASTSAKKTAAKSPAKAAAKKPAAPAKKAPAKKTVAAKAPAKKSIAKRSGSK